MYYYFSHNDGYNPTNSSTRTYFLLNSSTGGWHTFDGNITSDFEDRFGPVDPTTRLYDCQWYVNSPSSESIVSTIVIDEVSIHNSTADEFLPNNDFEDGTGDYWGSSRSGPAYINPSADRTAGDLSTNITVAAVGDNTNSYSYLDQYSNYPSGWFVQEPGTAIIEFDWKYNDTHNGGAQQYSYFYIYLENTTGYHEVRWYLGRDLDQNNLANTTTRTYLNATGFGARDSWQHQYIDLYEIFTELKLVNITMDDLTFYSTVGNHANSSVTLLVDDFNNDGNSSHIYIYPENLGYGSSFIACPAQSSSSGGSPTCLTVTGIFLK